MPAYQPENDERIAEWVDGRLSDRDLERFEAELGVNPELRAAAERYRDNVAKVRDALRQPLAAVDLSDRIMAAMASRDDQSAARRRLFPIVASAAAAAAIVMTYFAIQYMPVFEGELGPDATPLASSELRELEDRVSSLSPDREKLASMSKNNEPAPQELAAGSPSIEQILRNALESRQIAPAGRGDVGAAMAMARELVLIVELPQKGFGELASDLQTLGQAKTEAPQSRARKRPEAKSERDVAQDDWYLTVEQFMQLPLQRAKFKAGVAPPKLQGAYLGRDLTTGLWASLGLRDDVFAPLPQDIHFQVEGDEDQIIAYLKALDRILEAGQGRIRSQWAKPGVIKDMPVDGKVVTAQRRLHFVLRQRK